jgi:hypothetical protein
VPSLGVQSLIRAFDENGQPHNVSVYRAPVPGAPHLQGLPAFSWRNGRHLNLVDPAAGILECIHTKRRLRVEDWQGADKV